ncbi:hypothetical protein HYH03_003942 [Edaphochlamys debaryana]|uniref:Uncharacterized protein n=1 Tax=Edaphochlamys debaryana TaxID=47281 RepID=A0A835YBE4_9CHLO|nr:hypothetical protein HYH03_003942 [Edaphochlamys debaryana]|eukprot:KAG2498188.1 hypothetical protein HYH03_003942 [Edaphochlamys debaryana]
MASISGGASQFKGVLSEFQTLCNQLQKYEGTFSAEAKQLYQAAQKSVDAALEELQDLPPDEPSIAGYLTTGDKALSLRAVLQEVQQAVSNFTSGSIPVPRSTKEELSRVHGAVLSVKFALSSEQQLLITQMRKLASELQAQTAEADFDLIETNLDNAMRKVLQQVHGSERLELELLKEESEKLQSGVMAARASGHKQLEDMLSLALNSLQRLHVTKTVAGDGGMGPVSDDESSEAASSKGAGPGADLEDEDDDDEDPFFMPMPGAIKWADASKFKELAKPLAPEQPADKQFMIVMEDEAAHTPNDVAAAADSQPSTSAGGATPGLEALTLEDGAAGAAAAAAAAEGGEAAASPLASPPAASPRDAGDAAALARAASGAEEAPAASTSAPEAGAAAAAAGAAAAAADAAGADAAGAAAGAAGPVVAADPAAPPPEKLSDFVNFLNGENPGACMFHAQMRLSPEGCMKLANFLRSSARVRALSLSHNYLGDGGLRLICDGLRENKSVTALDLPDNNITDVGCAILAEAIKDNPSLTQLQLAYNKIGDQGAMALAQVIRSSNSLKKLGLAFNNIGKTGCQALTAAISANQSLKHMQLLPGNPVEEKDAKALAKALKRNNKFSIKQLLGLKGDS